MKKITKGVREDQKKDDKREDVLEKVRSLQMEILNGNIERNEAGKFTYIAPRGNTHANRTHTGKQTRNK